MTWIFLSPHLDDAIYSCGSLIADRKAAEPVEIWTVVTGDPPEGPLTAFARQLHDRWELNRENAFAVRRLEDIAACREVGASHRHFGMPDCIYRRDPQTGEPAYPTPESIFDSPTAHEKDSVPETLASQLKPLIPAGSQVLLPLGVGNHVDHQLVRIAGERIVQAPWYFADLPYILWDPEGFDHLVPEGYRVEIQDVSPAAQQTWMAGIKAYGSQFSSFWDGPEELAADIREYLETYGGLRIWKPDY